MRRFFEVLSRLHLDVAELDKLRIATVGQAGAQLLRGHDIEPEFVPDTARGDKLAETLPAGPGDAAVILGSRRTRPELREGLVRRGVMVQTLPIYAPEPCAEGLQALRDGLTRPPDPNGETRIMLVTSPSGVEAIVEALGDAPQFGIYTHIGWLAIGPTTARQAVAMNVPDKLIEQAERPQADEVVRGARRLAATLEAL